MKSATVLNLLPPVGYGCGKEKKPHELKALFKLIKYRSASTYSIVFSSELKQNAFSQLMFINECTKQWSENYT